MEVDPAMRGEQLRPTVNLMIDPPSSSRFWSLNAGYEITDEVTAGHLALMSNDPLVAVTVGEADSVGIARLLTGASSPQLPREEYPPKINVRIRYRETVHTIHVAPKHVLERHRYVREIDG